MLATFVLAAALPATAAPLAGLRYLVGSWACTYRAGSVRLPYAARYAYDGGGRALREVASFAGGGDEELFSNDARYGGIRAVVLDGQGNVTIMRGTGSDPGRLTYRSVYPDASITETFDRVSSTEYDIRATVRAGGKTSASVDTCTREGSGRY